VGGGAYAGGVKDGVPVGGASVVGPAWGGKPMAQVTMELDLPPGIEVTGYQRHGEGHGFEVTWPWPQRCRCDGCGRDEPACLEVKTSVHVVRDLDVWGQPSFWVYQPVFHRCPWCHHRQHVIPPFKRKDASYTYRFERHVLRLLIGSNEAEVARRLGIAAETVARIVRQQLAEAKAIDPGRVITDVGIDEISLKKRHKLYVTVLTDWTNPDQPEVLAVVPGRDEAAGQACLEKLSASQREQVRSYRADLGPAYHAACRKWLPKARGVADRFHVAKLFNEAVDAERKKNHAAIQGAASEGGAADVPLADVAVPPGPGDLGTGGAPAVGAAVR
jgi:transposase